MSVSLERCAAFDVVAPVLREWDPYGLLRMGAPEDEFDAEIRSIAKQISRIKSENDAVDAVSRVFFSAFDFETFKPEFRSVVGSKLFAALQRERLV